MIVNFEYVRKSIREQLGDTIFSRTHLAVQTRTLSDIYMAKYRMQGQPDDLQSAIELGHPEIGRAHV